MTTNMVLQGNLHISRSDRELWRGICRHPFIRSLPPSYEHHKREIFTSYIVFTNSILSPALLAYPYFHTCSELYIDNIGNLLIVNSEYEHERVHVIK